jgi:hypothetical protein
MTIAVLGVLRLPLTGTVTVIQGGNDLVLAIEGAGVTLAR